jgi:NHLM bacteriocin system ABC transporter ATP-binding protein
MRREEEPPVLEGPSTTQDGPVPVASLPDELFLLRLRYKSGRLLEAGSDRPIVLDTAESVWVVYSGQVDLFAVPMEAGKPAGPRRHLCRIAAGEAVFGMDPGGTADGAVVAVGGAGTRLIRVPRSCVIETARDPATAGEVARLVERWVERLSAGVTTELPSKECLLLEAIQELRLPAGGSARSRRGVLWVRGKREEVQGGDGATGRRGDGATEPDEAEGPATLPDPGRPVAPSPEARSAGSPRQRAERAWFLGDERLPVETGERFFPLSGHAWLQASEACRIEARETRELLSGEALWSGLDAFHAIVRARLEHVLEQAARAEQERLAGTQAANQSAVETAAHRLTAILNQEIAGTAPEDAHEAPLLTACRLVGQALRIPVQSTRGDIHEIARASRVRVRQVALQGDWWRQECGPLVAFTRDGEQPVALLPGRRGGYQVVDPAARTRRRLSAEEAARLADHAFCFYRALPERALSFRDLFGFGLQGCGRDLGRLALWGALGGALGLLMPLATEWIFASLIPERRRGLLLQVALALIIAAVAAAAFQVTRGIALLRTATKLDLAVQAALWDRLLRLPVPFFRRFTAGDLTMRALGIGAIRQTVAATALEAIVGSFFALFSFTLLFRADLRLGLVAMLSLLAIVAAGAVTDWSQQRDRHADVELQGQISGLVLQLITGIAKLRVAGAEMRAFGLWAKQFAAQRALAFRVRLRGNTRTLLLAVWPILGTMAIFAVAAGRAEELSTGAFLAFYAAFGQCMLAALVMSAAVTSGLRVLPMVARARPILEALPEVDTGKSEPGVLSGAIEINHVSFRYQAEGPLILDDLCLRVEPGEFVAIVGPSGSGKSTLFRLLIGFESPDAGAIYYDGQDLATLDLEAVRRQIGVVMQNGRLMPGDLYRNIVGATALTLEDAWEAARLAGIEEEIRQLPMGMHTHISEGGATFSGGQRQRLLIARAIVSRPRILFFDEATSALDNRTQATVSDSLESLQATRLVIAHRLSTVVNADRILVLEVGKIVESGTYEELMRRRGRFHALASRQLG